MRKILEYVEEKESVSKVEGIGWVSLLYSTVGLKIKIILSGNHFMVGGKLTVLSCYDSIYVLSHGKVRKFYP